MAQIIGGPGNDKVVGTPGDDTLTGGPGADIFVLSGGNDVITDFNPDGEGDRIQIPGTTRDVFTQVGGDLKNNIVLKHAGGTLTLTGPVIQTARNSFEDSWFIQAPDTTSPAPKATNPTTQTPPPPATPNQTAKDAINSPAFQAVTSFLNGTMSFDDFLLNLARLESTISDTASLTGLLKGVEEGFAAFGLGFDLASRIPRVLAAPNPWRQGFIELVDFAIGVGGSWGLGKLGAAPVLGTGVGAPLAPIVDSIISSGSSLIYTTYLSNAVQDGAGQVYDSLAPSLHLPTGGQVPRHAVVAIDLTPYKFDDNYYLSTYADARQAVESGTVRNAYFHYLTVGLNAGYKPNAQANPIPANQVELKSVPPPAPDPSMHSPDGMWVNTDGPSITDTAGNVWKLNHGLVNVNGVDDQTTARVIALAYKGGKIWQENADKLWWSKTAPSDQWSPAPGTPTSPEPTPLFISSSYTVVKDGLRAIIDAAQNTWSIVNEQVDVNGHIDPTTKNVIELAYKGGAVWQENTDHLWWMKASPSDQWSPPPGTPISPV